MRGFFGDRGEGKAMLSAMGLPSDIAPFSVYTFLQNGMIRWKDCNGYIARISFQVKPEQIVCNGSYRGKRKAMRVFREWDEYEDATTVAKLESEAIGDLCMRCIYEKMIE